ncbi:MAG: hypothetical protein IKQ86_06150, partial [Prevotella sp.]|nr:hypothetical protein [Prevotella sp.]
RVSRLFGHVLFAYECPVWMLILPSLFRLRTGLRHSCHSEHHGHGDGGTAHLLVERKRHLAAVAVTTEYKIIKSVSSRI